MGNWIYSALRFPEKDVQKWRFYAYQRCVQSAKIWNTVDPTVNGFHHSGEMDEVKILNLLYVCLVSIFSAYLDHYPYNTPGLKTPIRTLTEVWIWNMESARATLDMTSFRFWQVQSDNRILNLSPLKFGTMRIRFFTEGIELFNKGGFFIPEE